MGTNADGNCRLFEGWAMARAIDMNIGTTYVVNDS